MKSFKFLSGLVALVLTFVGASLLFGPLIPSETEVTGYQIFFAGAGIVVIAAAVCLWLWSTKAATTSK